MKSAKWQVLMLGLSLVLAAPAEAYQFKIGDNTTLNLDLLLQIQGQFAEKGAPNKDDWSKDFFLRRGRILLFGNLTKRISYFVDTDMPNWGKGGDWSAPFILQDAMLSFEAVTDKLLIVDAGIILLPFTRHQMQGAVGLSSLDYHTGMVRFPDGTHKFWRDAGAQLRGYLFAQKLQYRVGVFGGSQNVVLEKDATGKAITDADGKAVSTSNPQDLPRFTGHVRYAILGTETDLFVKSIYFAKEPILSIGVGADFVPNSMLRTAAVLDPVTRRVTTPSTIGNHTALAADAFLDLPIGDDQELVVQGTVLGSIDGSTKTTSGWGLITEAGFRWRCIQPLVGFDYFKSADDAGKGNYQAIHGGLNWWIKQHAANLKAAFTAEKKGAGDFTSAFTLQAQLFL